MFNWIDKKSTPAPKVQGVDTESKLQIDVLDLAEKLQLLPGPDEALRVLMVFMQFFQCGSFEKVRNLQLKITWKRCSKKLNLRKQISQLKISKRSNDVIPVTERVPVGQYIQTCGSCYKVHQSVYIYI